MGNYSISVLKAEKSRLEYELFKINKFNDSAFAHEQYHYYAGTVTVFHSPQKVREIENKIRDLDEVIKYISGK